MAEPKRTAADAAAESSTTKATQPSATPADIQPKAGSQPELTDTAKMLLGTPETKQVTIDVSNRKLTFTIRLIQSVDTFNSMGQFLFKRLTEEGVEVPQDARRYTEFINQRIASMTPDQLHDYQISDDHLTEKRMIICQGVIDVDFADLSQEQCPEGVVSVHKLTGAEINDLYLQIMNFSVPESDINTFRETDSTDETESGA